MRAGERPVEGSETLGDGDLALETIMLGLRTADGIDLERFEQRFGVDLAARNRPAIERAVDGGLLRRRDRRLVPTASGLAVADGLAASLDVDPPEEQSRDRCVEEPELLSILELKGLGKELREDLDAAAHVERERRSWD